MLEWRSKDSFCALLIPDALSSRTRHVDTLSMSTLGLGPRKDFYHSTMPMLLPSIVFSCSSSCTLVCRDSLVLTVLHSSFQK
ncbi:hypothetical protein ARMGADRAFT_47612 [Armillaria gallica]|uniref:Uncharacterized protein n=1 Tax=Armillaria gallica TaxID=47427 RepID=A0A2H3EV86_ARMGA|nr:hypothetical protein ARMGADRAFT_47612 [Armillaria gallica]